MTSALVQKPFTVLVEGNIGCGKTTFLQHFSEVGLSVISKKTLMGPPSAIYQVFTCIPCNNKVEFSLSS